jgi:hypothetical protein
MAARPRSELLGPLTLGALIQSATGVAICRESRHPAAISHSAVLYFLRGFGVAAGLGADFSRQTNSILSSMPAE